MPESTAAEPTLRDATRTWATIGLHSFGGPAGQIAVLHREIVERRRWVPEERFSHALGFAMLLPGPEAMQLATYLGWLLHGVRGGLVAGLLFIAPGIAVMLALSALYVAANDISAVAGAFTGLQAAVLVLVASAFWRIAGRTVHGPAMAALAAASFIAVAFLGVPFPLIVAVAAVIGWLAFRGPGHGIEGVEIDHVPPAKARGALRAGIACVVAWLVPVAAVVAAFGQGSVLAQQALLFSRAALVTFGGAYAVLTYVAQDAVAAGWITTDAMATGLGLAETTPGPLVLVLQFVGFVGAYANPGELAPAVAALLGAAIAVWATFLPSFAFIFLGAPYVERLRANRALTGALRGVMAAVAGVVLSLALWFALHVAFTELRPAALGPLRYDVPVWSSAAWGVLAITAVSAVLLARRVPTLAVLGVAAALGAVGSLLGLLG